MSRYNVTIICAGMLVLPIVVVLQTCCVRSGSTTHKRITLQEPNPILQIFPQLLPLSHLLSYTPIPSDVALKQFPRPLKSNFSSVVTLKIPSFNTHKQLHPLPFYQPSIALVSVRDQLKFSTASVVTLLTISSCFLTFPATPLSLKDPKAQLSSPNRL